MLRPCPEAGAVAYRGDVPHLRPYRPADLPAVDEICVLTGDAGADATASYPRPALLSDVYARPYLRHDPDLAVVLADDADRAVGYVLGTACTAGFVQWYRQVWVPELAGTCPVPPRPPVTREHALLAAHHAPERMLVPQAAHLPAHLHVDLLPSHQGAGWGRALIEAFVQLLVARGVPGVHLCTDTANTRAVAFYTRLGFTPLPVPGAGGAAWFGLALPDGRPRADA